MKRVFKKFGLVLSVFLGLNMALLGVCSACEVYGVEKQTQASTSCHEEAGQPDTQQPKKCCCHDSLITKVEKADTVKAVSVSSLPTLLLSVVDSSAFVSSHRSEIFWTLHRYHPFAVSGRADVLAFKQSFLI
jgi:hypothetical protein